MPSRGIDRSVVARLREVTRRAVRESRPQICIALKFSIDAGNLVRQPLLGVFLTDWAEPKINGHAAVQPDTRV
jgi:hypothetical protein